MEIVAILKLIFPCSETKYMGHSYRLVSADWYEPKKWTFTERPKGYYYQYRWYKDYESLERDLRYFSKLDKEYRIVVCSFSNDSIIWC